MKCSICGNTYYRPRTFDSQKCYKRWVWKNRWKKIKSVLKFILGFSIIFIGYLLLNYFIWAVETYIN